MLCALQNFMCFAPCKILCALRIAHSNTAFFAFRSTFVPREKSLETVESRGKKLSIATARGCLNDTEWAIMFTKILVVALQITKQTIMVVALQSFTDHYD
jgi:hypothetical protein